MEFKKYQHVEKWDTPLVEDIVFGDCHIFPKIDGTNAVIWYDGQRVRFGSRNRELSLEKDNAGFMRWGLEQHASLLAMAMNNRGLYFYGEWLVPHTLKTYREDAWRDFYVFDVWDSNRDRWVHYDDYSTVAQYHGVSFIVPQSVIRNPTLENIVRETEGNTFLLQEGAGVGEGVVIKNYDYTNRHGDRVWAKFVRGDFKTKHTLAMGVCEKTGGKVIESEIAERHCTPNLVQKTRAKIELQVLNDNAFFDDETLDQERMDYARREILANARGKVIPQLLQTVFHDLVTEEIWAILKGMKGPKVIDFDKLRKYVAVEVKKAAGDLF